MTWIDISREGDDLYDGHCVAGCQHYHGGEIKHHPDCGHYPDSLTKVNAAALTAALDRAEKAEAEVAKLQAAIKRQAGAAKTLRQCTLDEVRHLREKDRANYIAPTLIEGEREANALLSSEIERLEAALARTEANRDDVLRDLHETREKGMRIGYLAGFRASCVGWNGEHPYRNNAASPTTDPIWVETRDRDILALIAKDTE